MTLESIVSALKIIVLASVLFVWVVRYQNIVNEFKKYSLPSWLRDLVGILKISFVFMMFNTDPNVVQIGAAGIFILMIAAFITHLKVKNPTIKMLPSVTLMGFSFAVLVTAG